MFAIAAINDTDSKEHWEPLAPTKEAQGVLLSSWVAFGSSLECEFINLEIRGVLGSSKWQASRYLYDYIHLLEKGSRVEVLEGMSEKIRKRFKNPKLASGNCAKVYKKICVAWYRSLIISPALITPLNKTPTNETQSPNQIDTSSESTQLPCVDLQTNELCSSSPEDLGHLKDFESKWNNIFSQVKNIVLKKAAEKDLDTAATLVRSCYNLSRDTSSSTLLSEVNLYVVPSQLGTIWDFNLPKDGVSVLDVGAPKQLLLWAYTLLHGSYTSISAVMKHCEENAKGRLKKDQEFQLLLRTRLCLLLQLPCQVA